MKNILITSLMMLSSCNPAKLETQTADSGIEIIDEVPTQFGIIDTENCDQKAIGSTVCNMIFYDQNMDVWQLYDHRGKIIILDFSTVWCAPCQNAGHYAQPIQDDYGKHKIEFVTVLVDGATGEPPTEEEINEWASSHNLTTSPVLYANRSVMDPSGETGYLVGGFPTYVLIDKDLTIATGIVGFNDQYLRSIIDGLL